MTIRAPNLMPGSRARSPYNEFIVTLPATNFFGIAASQTCTAGTPLTLSGSYCKNITTDGFGCDLRIPVTPVMILSDPTKIVSLLIEGLDHLGRPVSEIVTKALGTTSTASPGYRAFSRITRVVPTSVSGSTNIGLGFCYGGWAGNSSYTITTRRVANDDAVRRVPLPILPSAAGDVLSVKFLGLLGGPASFVQYPTITATLTYAATTVTSGDVGDFASVAAFDVLHTSDGYTGVATGAAVAGAVTVTQWMRAGAVGTPANFTGNANSPSGIVVTRYGLNAMSNPANVNLPSGLVPGVELAGQITATTALLGCNAATATWGFLGDLYSEPLQDTQFLVTYKPGTLF